MAKFEHLFKLSNGVEAWNEWREQNSEITPDLSGADLMGADLDGANLSGADLTGILLSAASLRGADFRGADLSGARLGGAFLSDADFSRAILCGANLGGAVLIEANLIEANLINARLSHTLLLKADLSKADLSGANLSGANFSGADLSNANLCRTNMVETNFEKATLTGCRIYGISAWDLKLEGAIQSDLIITPCGDPRGDPDIISIDKLEVAQFIYLILNNEKLRDVIDTITSKVVLILGSFKDDRREILYALKEELRKRDYLPIIFDFKAPKSRNTTETITLLARMARFVIADLTDAKSIPQELYAIVPHLSSVPVQPLLVRSQKEYGMFESFSKYQWVLETYYYDSIEEVLASIKEKVIVPAEAKVRE